MYYFTLLDDHSYQIYYLQLQPGPPGNPCAILLDRRHQVVDKLDSFTLELDPEYSRVQLQIKEHKYVMRVIQIGDQTTQADNNQNQVS